MNTFLSVRTIEKLLKITVLLVLLISYQTYGQLVLDSTTLEVSTIAENLDTPWEILWGPDDRIWFTERGGNVSRVDPENGNIELLLRIDEVVEQGESGLLGMALHPNFSHPDSQFVYLVYTYNAPVLTEKLVRYTFEINKLINPLVLLDGIPAKSNHDGARIIISPNRKILLSTGDATNTSLSQNPSSLAGKILRLNLDGTIPSDNPISDSPVYSIGHRNPQGLIQGSNGIIYSSEHGPANDDEINIIDKNANYGWPNVQGFCNTASEQNYCTANSITEPIIAWTPTLAVAGIDYYQHEAIPEWNHALLLTTLKEDDFRVLRLNERGDAIIDEKLYFNNEYGRLRDICISPAGDIYFSTSNRDGRANSGFPTGKDDRIIRISNNDVDVITGINNLRREAPTALYPNPTSQNLHLNGISGTSILIHDLASRKMDERAFSQNIDISGLRSGTYILTVISGDSRNRFKFVKK